MKLNLISAVTLLEVRSASLRLFWGNQTIMRFKKFLRTISESCKDPIWKITCNFTLKWPQWLSITFSGRFFYFCFQFFLRLCITPVIFSPVSSCYISILRKYASCLFRKYKTYKPITNKRKLHSFSKCF